MATSVHCEETGTYDLQTTTVWSFPDRGTWATHNGKYRGNWSPHVPRNLILRYSEPGDVVLDCFLGSGTTLVEAFLLGRRGIGVDISPAAIELARTNLALSSDGHEPVLRVGDARQLTFLDDASVDLVCTHPPYANIIRYSDVDGDLSHLPPTRFLNAMSQVAKELFRVVRPDAYCAVLMGDTRRNRHVQPLGFRTMERFLAEGFVLKEIIIKEQHNCKATPYWRRRSIEMNFLLLAHEYLFVFRRP